MLDQEEANHGQGAKSVLVPVFRMFVQTATPLCLAIGCPQVSATEPSYCDCLSCKSLRYLLSGPSQKNFADFSAQ